MSEEGAHEDKLEIIKMLLDRGADPSITYKETGGGAPYDIYASTIYHSITFPNLESFQLMIVSNENVYFDPVGDF